MSVIETQEERKGLDLEFARMKRLPPYVFSTVDAMKMEARLSAEDAASVTAESIAVRTDAVQDRGRTQGSD